MDELFDVIPGGRWTFALVGLLAVPGVRRQLRPVAKAVIKAGLVATDQVKELVAEAREQAGDLVAEARAERTAGQDDLAAADGQQETGGRKGRAAATEPAGAV